MLTEGQLRTLQAVGVVCVQLAETIFGHDSDDSVSLAGDERAGDAAAQEAGEADKQRRFRLPMRRRLSEEERTFARQSKEARKQEKRAKREAKREAKRKPKKQRGGFVRRTSYQEILPALVSSVHVHVERVLFQLSRLAGTAEQRAIQRGQGAGHLLLAATANDVVFHHFFAHGVAAPLPHLPEASAIWQQHDSWLEKVRPVASLPAAGVALRQSTTITYMRRLLVLADGGGTSDASRPGSTHPSAGSSSMSRSAPTSSSSQHTSGRRSTRLGSVSSVFANRKRVILLQPAAAQQPPLFTLVMTTIHPENSATSAAPVPAKAAVVAGAATTIATHPAAAATVSDGTVVGGADVDMPAASMQAMSEDAMPPRSVYLHVSPLKVGADPHAIFQVAEFVTGAVDESLAPMLQAARDAAAAPAAEEAVEEVAEEALETLARSRLLVQVERATVQLPGMRTASGSLNMEAGVERFVITNSPGSHELCCAEELAQGLYDGWLFTHPTDFPAQGAHTPLPSAAAIYGLSAADAASETPAAVARTAAGKVANDLFLGVQNAYVRTQGKMHEHAIVGDLVVPCSFSLQVKHEGLASSLEQPDRDEERRAAATRHRKDRHSGVAKRYVILRVSSHVSLTVSNPALAYLQRLMDTVSSLPTHELRTNLKVLTSAKAAAPEAAPVEDGEPAEDTTGTLLFVFAHVDHADMALVDPKGDEILAATMQRVQVAIEPPDSPHSKEPTLVRAAIRQLGTRQTSLTTVSQQLASTPQGSAGMVSASTDLKERTETNASKVQADTEQRGGGSDMRGDAGSTAPQVRLRVVLPHVTAAQKASVYEAQQERRLQLRSILVHEHATGTGARAPRGKDATRPASKPSSGSSGQPAVQSQSRRLDPVDLALAAIDEEANPERAPAAGGGPTGPTGAPSASEPAGEDDSTTDESATDDADVDDEDFATVDERQLRAAWLQAETWRGTPTEHAADKADARTAHARELLENVDAFLQSDHHREFMQVTLEPYVPPKPPQLARDTAGVLPYHAVPTVPTPTVEVIVANVTLDLDTVPLDGLADLFRFADSLPNGDDPHAAPPADLMAHIELQLQHVQLRLCDGTTLARIRLFLPEAAPRLMRDASTLISLPSTRIIVHEDRRMEILAEGGQASGDREAMAGAAQAAAGAVTDDVAKLREQLAQARAELAYTHRLLAESHRALKVCGVDEDGCSGKV